MTLRQTSKVPLPVSTSEDLIAEAAMLGASGARAVVFVEGPSDQRLFFPLFTSEIKVLVAGGWSTLEGVFAPDHVSRWPGHLAIFGVADRDYRLALGMAVDNDRLVYSHFRDLECEMVDSRAIVNVLAENIATSRNAPGAIELIVRQAVEACVAVGVVRFWAAAHGVGVTFKNLDFGKFLDSTKVSVEPNSLMTHLQGAQNSAIRLPRHEECITFLREQLSSTLHRSPLRITRGHDLASYIALRLKKGAGKKGTVDQAEELESQLRIAYSSAGRGPTLEKLRGLMRDQGLCEFLI